MQIRKIINIIAAVAMFSMTASLCVTAEDELESLPPDITDAKKTSPYVKPVIDGAAVGAEADSYFYAGMQEEDKNLREAYFSQALAKYMLLLSVNPKDAAVYTQIGIIHDMLDHPKLAKEYLFKAVNLDYYNPFPNFYFGEHYYKIHEYNNALEYYKKAYDNGYRNEFVLNYKLAVIYEKLGDIAKAKQFYLAAYKLTSGKEEIKDKIDALDKIYYSKSDYK